MNGRRRSLQGLVAAVLLFAHVACGRNAEPVPSTPQPTATTSSRNNGGEPLLSIIAMGDSLTEGLNVEPEEAYPAQLERKLRSTGYDVPVINAGISGETSSGARSRVEWILAQQPDIVILETGGNDGLRGIDPAVTAQNIDEMLKLFTENNVTVVLVGIQIVQNMGADYVDEFRAVYPTAAAAHDVIFVPFFLEGVAGDARLNQPDQIHPTAEGYAVVVETIYPHVVEAIESVKRDGDK